MVTSLDVPERCRIVSTGSGPSAVSIPFMTNFFIVLLSVAITGCLTMVQGDTQVVSIDSTPQGASIEINHGDQKLETPTEAVLSRRRGHVLTVRKDGFETDTVVVERKFSWGIFRNLIWIHPAGWIIGFIVDTATGSTGRLEPESVSVTLTPIVSPSEVEVAPPSD